MKPKAAICPSLLAEDPAAFSTQLNHALPFAGRIHIDIMDGVFAKPRSIRPDQLHWPANVITDIHVMYQRPLLSISALLGLRPQLVIIHSEAEVDLLPFAAQLHQHGIQFGVALLPETPVQRIAFVIRAIDHILIFSGNLGQFGGQADLNLLTKVHELRALKPGLEIGWDGGVNANNVRQLVDGGVDVLNVGGFIQRASNPQAAYQMLERLAR